MVVAVAANSYSRRKKDWRERREKEQNKNIEERTTTDSNGISGRVRDNNARVRWWTARPSARPLVVGGVRQSTVCSSLWLQRALIRNAIVSYILPYYGTFSSIAAWALAKGFMFTFDEAQNWSLVDDKSRVSRKDENNNISYALIRYEQICADTICGRGTKILAEKLTAYGRSIHKNCISISLTLFMKSLGVCGSPRSLQMQWDQIEAIVIYRVAQKTSSEHRQIRN